MLVGVPEGHECFLLKSEILKYIYRLQYVEKEKQILKYEGMPACLARHARVTISAIHKNCSSSFIFWLVSCQHQSV